MDILEFAWFPDLDMSLEILAKMAMPENWQYRVKPDVNHEYPILFNYLKFTFSKLFSENLIAITADKSCFNTGLVTTNQEEIYALFGNNKKSGYEPYFFYKFCPESDRDLKDFHPLPSIATYFDDPSVLLFDTRLDIRADYDHIIEENIARFPPPFDDPSNSYMLNNTIRGAIELAKKRVKRNYKTAVPQYYQGKIQLLLPLSLFSPAKADLALVVELDKEKFYHASTCLSLDMAYNNARLLARPDIEWLSPVT
ncbi:MAG: DUF3825 domain-containing protein [Candidatus Cloacimonetes bacterium]|nr:DUF3825 domain-containing protein [Candidatus Cloacimonadota bacterium]